ncbi:cytochrome P450 [Serendipita vermifera]|nr:cytochrome P450 [Serendipita vermifera]
MDTLRTTIEAYIDLNYVTLSKMKVAMGLGTIIIGRMIWDELQFRRKYGYADYRPAFSPLTVFGVLFGLGFDFNWEQRHTLYPKTGREYIVLKPWAWGDPIIYTNSIEVLKQIGGSGVVSPWIKPDWTMRIHNFWGKNLVAANDVEWRRQRKVMQPAFNPKTYELVWSETLRLYKQMIISEKFPTRKGDKVSFARFQDLTQRAALCIILACGFGIPLNWDEDELTVKREGYKLDDGVNTQRDNLLLISEAPNWVLKLPIPKFKYIAESSDGLRAWFNRAIERKRAEVDEHVERNGEVNLNQIPNDVFTRINLINYLDKKANFTDSEIIGNTWVIFFAGHETTANMLAATFCLLAVNPEEQETVYKEVKEVMEKKGTDQLPFDAYDLLPKTRAALMEALRMYPPGNILVRQAVEDNVLRVPHTGEDGVRNEKDVLFQKGTHIVCDMIGAQYNTRVYPNPDVFNPSRWYNATSDDAYTAFSIGPRTCIGRKFTLAEGVCWVAHVIKNFAVGPLLADGEDLDDWKHRNLAKGEFKLTFAVGGAPLTFTRR